jgi:aminoglycoside phosphotransferase (APT) family kinase protein
MLDIEQPDDLIAYLRRTGHIATDETPRIKVLQGGVSNRTVLVERSSGESWVLKQALEKLRVTVDWFSSPERIHREASGLRWLGKIAPPNTLPRFIFEDRDTHVLAMEAIPQPHENWKQMLLAGRLNFDHIVKFGSLLGVIHRQAYQRRGEIAPPFEDRSFFESLRLEPYYLYTATQVAEAADFLNALVDETRNTLLTLVHGDYSPKNILIYQNRLILLDHEVIHWGDPAFDVGFSMTHLLSKAHHLREKRADFQQAALRYWQAYFAEVQSLDWTGSLEQRSVRHTLACLLARVAGRSPLEYLDSSARSHQREAVLPLIADPPSQIADLIDQFIGSLP